LRKYLEPQPGFGLGYCDKVEMNKKAELPPSRHPGYLLLPLEKPRDFPLPYRGEFGFLLGFHTKHTLILLSRYIHKLNDLQEYRTVAEE
jgi:hypothetical protein